MICLLCIMNYNSNNIIIRNMVNNNNNAFYQYDSSNEIIKPEL